MKTREELSKAMVEKIHAETENLRVGTRKFEAAYRAERMGSPGCGFAQSAEEETLTGAYMSKCDRSKRATEVLSDIAEGIKTLQHLVKEQPRGDEKREPSLWDRAYVCADSMFVMHRSPYQYAQCMDRTALIEALVREEIEACAVALEENGYISSNPATTAVRARLDR